jgi:nickel-dependent lactate racemase
MDKKIEFPYGKGNISFRIPEDIMIDVIYSVDTPAGDNDEEQELQSALDNPIGSPPLKELARGKKNIIILVSDISRPAPSKKILGPVLKELKKAGVENNSVTIIFGLGLHRHHTKDEQIHLVGEDIYSNYKCIDHDVSDCVYIGDTSRGTPIHVFRPVVEADLIIGTGNLEYHYSAGYSGGMKAVMPGVCGEETIRPNHSLMLKPTAVVGRIKDNPMRGEIEEIGRKIGVKFMVNVVLDSNKNIIKAVAGDPIDAHREGCKFIDSIYKRKIGHKYDIVIASPGGFPKDINLYQAHKGLDNASFAVNDGGAIVLVAEATEGFGNDVFKEYMMKAVSIDEVLKRINDRFEMGGHKAAKICQILKRTRVYLLSSLDPGTARTLFMTPVRTIEEAIEKEKCIQSKELTCLAMPYAGATLPGIDDLI